MNLQPYRSSFSVVVADSQLTRGGEAVNLLANAGYSCEHRLSVDDLLTGVLQNPPHVVLLHYDDRIFFRDPQSHRALIEKLLHHLPEAHVFILAAPDQLSAACELYATGVYDCLAWPLSHPRQLLQAVDRAIETDYYMYLNEQLQAESGPGVKKPATGFAMFEVWLKETMAATTREQLIELWMKEAVRVHGTDAAVYMNFVESRQTLVAQQALGLPASALEGVGVDLAAQEPGFQAAMLKNPARVRALHDFVAQGLQRRQAVYYCLEFQGRVLGIFILPARAQQVFADDEQENDYLHGALHILRDRFERLEDRQRLKKFSVYDDASEAYHANFMLQKMKEEVSRARRLLRPVALLYISLDGYDDLTLSQPAEAIEKLVKGFAEVLHKNSRLNDLVGRLSRDRFLLLLPHTDRRGGAVKAERLRRLIERADFSAILGGLQSVTISVGISEYPTLCRDAEELLSSAESAMLEVRRTGHNRICLAAAPPRMVPDFVVKDAKGLPAHGG